MEVVSHKAMRFQLKLLSLLSVIAALAFFTSCSKEEPQEPNTGLKLVDTRLGGCNNGLRSLLVVENPKADTLIYELNEDSVKIFVGLNYVCCAPFETESKIENGVINIYIKDVCDLSKESCYCKCMCYYTFDFIFNGRDKDTYPYKVFLFDPKVGKDKEIFTGTIAIRHLNKTGD